MTSGIFHTTSPTSVIVDRASRQRRELRGIEELAKSISEIGLIHPITLTEDLVLVAGERRLSAVISLGWSSIPYQLASDLSEIELQQLELEENVKRSDLSWQEQTKAIADYHNLRSRLEHGWTQTKTAEALGFTTGAITKHLDVSRAMAQPRVAQAPKFSVALGVVSRSNDRAKASVLEPLTPLSTKSYPGDIVNADFFSYDYVGPPVNFLHCDFPYGVGMQSSEQGAGTAHGTYLDTPELYFQLLSRLRSFVADFCSPSCHIMFWFSMKFYQETYDALTAAGFTIDPFPLIWHKSDNSGILPDPSRGPRRTYETAFFGSRGDRKVVTAVANSFAGPTSRLIHMSEKPLPVLQHFFRMFVDSHSVVFDPSAGSGSSIRAAEGAGASFALGLEIDPEFHRLALAALKGARK